MHSKASHILKIIFCALFFIGFINLTVYAVSLKNAKVTLSEQNTKSFEATVANVNEEISFETENGAFVYAYTISLNEYDSIIYVDKLLASNIEALDNILPGDHITFWVQLSDLDNNGNIFNMNVVQLLCDGEYIITFESYNNFVNPVFNIASSFLTAGAIILGILFAIFLFLVIFSFKNQKREAKIKMQSSNISDSSAERFETFGDKQEDYSTSENLSSETAEEEHINIKYSLCKKEVTKGIDKFILKKFKPAIIMLSLLFIGSLILTTVAMNSLTIPKLVRGIGIVSAMCFGFALFAIFVCRLRYIHKYKADEEGKVTMGVTFGNTLKFINFNTKETTAWNYSSISNAYEFVDYFTLYWNGEVLVVSKDTLSSGTILEIRKFLARRVMCFKTNNYD